MTFNNNSLKTKTLIVVLVFGLLPIFLFTYGSQILNAKANPKPQVAQTKEEIIEDITEEEQLLIATGTINGHEYVDFDLPSGLKWATCNVGASRPEDYGDYFAWGETKTKSSYDQENSETYEKDYQWLISNDYIGRTVILPSNMTLHVRTGEAPGVCLQKKKYKSL